jgi:dienelactone hydrolase
MKYEMKRLACFTIIVFVALLPLSAQRKITFLANDGLEITADVYLFDSGAPYIILLHQENSSRGEYREIAPKLHKMGFNCLAVDLRSGKECNFIQNETAARAKENNIPATLLDCEKDIIAAIEHVGKISTKNRCVIFGSLFSASLAIKVADKSRKITAVIAFNPGEYFAPLTVKDWVTDFKQLLYIMSTKREQAFVTEIVKDIPAQLITRYQPTDDGGIQGAQALWNDNPQASEIWMSLLLFMNKVKEEKNWTWY